MIFKHAVPILYSSDVLKSLSYYTDVLGFESRWEWGNPPTFGGVSKNSVEIFFCEKGQGNPGTWLSVMVDNVDEFYETVKVRGAKILSLPENMEWGFREMLVEDPDGHKIRFGQNAPATGREKSLPSLASTIRIIARVPTAKEHLNLVSAVGWSLSLSNEMEEKLLNAVVYAAVAEDTMSGEVVGCALLLGDNASFYYIKDLMVHPDWQCKGVGTSLMRELVNWLEKNGANNALVGLYTGENLATFYKEFGFTQAFGMNRYIRRNENT
jgi:GNAT superfamily N-acetyltransferase/catechol 2,3-dioxygenase-like lactoylglutathione lyase family enzyme